MTAKELQKRNERSQHLRVIQVDEDTYYVESSEGKICYRVMFEGDAITCTCGDFTRGIKGDANFRCKHIISVFNSIPIGEVQHGQLLERAKPKLDEKYIIEIDGQQFVSFKGLLQLGHQIGISQLSVQILQFPSGENSNTSICRATLISKLGEEFSDVGDANPSNCNSRIAKHIIRMSSTRSLARVLRLFTGCGITAIEELEDLNDVIHSGNGNCRGKAAKQPDRKPKAMPKDEDPEKAKAKAPDRLPNRGNGDGGSSEQKEPAPPKSDSKGNGKPTGEPKMSEAQKRALWNLSRRRGISVEELHRMALETYGMELEYLSTKDASSFIRSLQQTA
jgi:hypothetical protein